MGELPWKLPSSSPSPSPLPPTTVLSEASDSTFSTIVGGDDGCDGACCSWLSSDIVSFNGSFSSRPVSFAFKATDETSSVGSGS